MYKEKVSIIIPIYNSEKTLKRSIESIISQTYKDWELLLVDDGSCDDSVNICEAFCSSDERIKLIKSVHSGPSKARNLGIECSQYDYIAFNDSDDLWDETKLERQLEKMREGFDVVYCRYIYDRGYRRSYIPAKYYKIDELEGNILYSLWKANKIGTPTLMTKRSVLDKVGYFNEELKALEDYELVLRMSKQYKIGFVDKPLVVAEYFDNDGVNSNLENQIDAISYIDDIYGQSDVLPYHRKHIMRCLALMSEEERRSYLEGHTDLLSKFAESSSKLLKLIEDDLKKSYQFQDRVLDIKLLSVWLKNNGVNGHSKIGIFGASDLGLKLAAVLESANYKVTCFFDTNVFFLEKHKVVCPGDIGEKVDVVISTLKISPDWISDYTKRILSVYGV